MLSQRRNQRQYAQASIRDGSPQDGGKESSGQNHMNCIAKESAFGLVDFMDALPVSFIDFSCNFFVIYFLRLTVDLIGSLFSSFLRRKDR